VNRSAKVDGPAFLAGVCATAATLTALANEANGHGGRASRTFEVGTSGATAPGHPKPAVQLASVPFTVVMTGPERIATDTAMAAVTCAVYSLRR
jgi:hypothetical protein